MSGPRETAIAALLSLVAGAYPWANPPSRRFKLWADTPPASRPCCFLYEGGKDAYNWTSAEPRRSIDVRLIAYIAAKDPAAIGAAQINDIMDALDAAFAPTGADAALGRLTLGGAVYQCRIDGAVFKDPGDLDGDGLLVAPIKLILP